MNRPRTVSAPIANTILCGRDQEVDSVKGRPMCLPRSITSIAMRQIQCFPAGTRFARPWFRGDQACVRRRSKVNLFTH